MATLPSATSSLDQSGAGVGVPTVDYVCILSCTRDGTAAVIRNTTRVQDNLDTFGQSAGADLAAHLVQRTKRPFLFGKIATATAGSVGPVDMTGVTGTAVGSFAGANDGPYDDEDIVYEILTGGVLGTPGIEFRYSRDGERTWSGKIRLGTSLTHTITDAGVTHTFGTGTQTLVDGDKARAKCTGPMYDATGLAACFTALKAHTIRPRIIVVVGDCTTAQQVQDCIDEVEAYKTDADRDTVVITSLRDRYHAAVMQGAPADVDFDGTAHTITRATGSWITDGFKVGMVVTNAGSASNNGELGVLTTVTGTVLTFASGLTTEANVDGSDLTLTAEEPEATWRAALEAIVGATPSTQKLDYRVLVTGGRAMRASPINKCLKRRPFSWPLAIREMEHDIHISPAQVDLGPLAGWSIVDADGNLQEHDERANGGLLASRIACARTFNEKPGVYVALPVTLDADGNTLSRLPVVLVGQLACTVAGAAFTEKLNGPVLKKPDGTPQESECRRIEEYVRSRLKQALLVPGREGPRASSIDTVSLARDVVLVAGATVPWTVEITALGYLEQLPGTVRIA